MMIFKRIVSAITCTAVLASSLSVFSGCSMKEFFNNSSSETASESGVLTNGDWLKMVNDAFGMQVDESDENGEIDTAKAWGVIDEDEQIDKNAPVDDKFIASTLTRAAGFADRNASYEDIASAAVQHGIISSADAKVSSPEEAMKALAAAQQDWAHPNPEEHRNIDLDDKVQNFSDNMNVNDVKIEGDVINIPTAYATSLDQNSVFIVPKDEGGKGGAYKVISVTENGDGTTSVKSVPAKLDEVYKKIDVSGTFDADLSNFEPTNSNVTVLSSQPEEEEGAIKPLGYAGDDAEIQQLGSASLKAIEFSAELGDGFKVKAAIKDVKLTSDIDWDFGLFSGLDVNRVFMTVDYTSEISLEKEWEAKPAKEFDLKKFFLDEPSIEIGKVAVYICPGISVNLRVKLSLEASGSIKVSVQTENCKGFELVGDQYRSINETSKSAEIGVSGEAGAYATLILALSLDYLVGEVDLLSLELKVGPTLKAAVTIHDREGVDNDLLCFDISGYLKIELKLYLLKDLMDLLGLEASITLVDLDETSSPIRWNAIHIENFEKVDHCTADEQEATTTTAPATIATGIFELDTTYLSLDAGSSATIGIKSLPAGYSASDLEWSSNDTSKVTVDGNGNVTAVAGGSAAITVKSKDGKIEQNCVVVVKAKINVSNAILSDNNTEAIAA